MKFTYILLLSILLTSVSFGQIYKNSDAPIDERVNDLLARMTLDEKIGQMTMAEISQFSSDTTIDSIRIYKVGAVLNGGGTAPPGGRDKENWISMYDALQKKALNTRLEIPMIWGTDAVHGHNNVTDAVIFPHNIGLGCTRNSDLMKEIGRITALEVAATGIDWTFAPCIAVAKNEKWGRTYESYSEDTELVTQLGEAITIGLQGDSLDDPYTILACAKHFAGDGGTNGGINAGNVYLKEQDFRDIHIAPYIDAINQGVGSIMISYNSFKGTKMHAHKYFVDTVLRQELGFEGIIVSDWAAIDQIPGTYKEDIEKSINAGLDMIMVPNNYQDFIRLCKENVLEGKISNARIDDAVTRILTQKFKLGLFERPYTESGLDTVIGHEDHRIVAREAVRESVVLLHTKENILPIEKQANILLAGNHADNIGLQCGGWSVSWQGLDGNFTKGTTIKEGLEQAGASVTYDIDGNGEGNFDYAIAVIGEYPYAEGFGDVSNISLSREDVLRVRNLSTHNIPVIVVLITGRPLILDPILPYADAIICAWLPGTEANGVTDILFGDYLPTGKLSFSWPRSNKQLPINIGDAEYDPLFAYGYGLDNFTGNNNGNAPEIFSVVTNNYGNNAYIIFNKAISSFSALSNFTLTVNNEQITIDSITFNTNDSTIIELYFNSKIGKNDKALLQYSEGEIVAQDGGILTEFSKEIIYLYYTENEESLSGISLYPNPVQNILYISPAITIKTVSVISILGQIVYKKSDVGTIDNIDLSFLKKGTYLLSFILENGRLYTKTILKK